MASLRQSFLNGALTRLLDPDGVLRAKIVEFVGRGDFGLASGPNPDGTYERIWYQELLPPDEVAFEAGVLLVKKAEAQALKKKPVTPLVGGGGGGAGATGGTTTTPVAPGGNGGTGPGPGGTLFPDTGTGSGPTPATGASTCPVSVAGTIPPELWNRLGTKVLPKLRTLKDFQISVNLSASAEASGANELKGELRQIVEDLGLKDSMHVD